MHRPTTLPWAFQDIYERELPFVRCVLRRRGLSSAWVDDAAHDTLLIAWCAWGTYDPTRPLRPWLAGIAARVARDLQRRAFWHRERGGLDVERADDRPDAEAALIALERQHALQRALRAIPRERCAVLVMHELDEVPIPEVARVLRMPLNTAYSRLRLARRDLAAGLKEAGPPMPARAAA